MTADDEFTVTPAMWNVTTVAIGNGGRQAVVTFAEPLDGITITYDRTDPGVWSLEDSGPNIVKAAWRELIQSGMAEAFGFPIGGES